MNRGMRLRISAASMLLLSTTSPTAAKADEPHLDIPDTSDFYGVSALVTDLVEPTELSLDPRTGFLWTVDGPGDADERITLHRSRERSEPGTGALARLSERIERLRYAQDHLP